MRKRIVAIGFIVALVVGAALPSAALAAGFGDLTAANCHGETLSANAKSHGGSKNSAEFHFVNDFFGDGTVQGAQKALKALGC